MKSKVMIQVDDRRIEGDEVEVPKLGPGNALLRVEACGLCGSDIEQYRGAFTEKGLVKYPLIPGHEPVGVIEEIGQEAAQVWGVKVGDRVALEPHLSCGFCHLCLSGKYHMCKSVRDEGLPAYGYMPLDFGHGLWGGYSQYIHLHPRTIMHVVPDTIPLELATMYQALAAGVRWAVHVPETAMGDRVLILGCGQRGLGSVIACHEAGAGQIIVTGLSKDRHKLALARMLGADHTIVVDQENTVEQVMALTGGQGADVIVDVVPASTHPIVNAIEVAAIGATIVIGGVKGWGTTVEIDSDKILYKELTIKGVYSQGRRAYEESLRLLCENKYDLSRMKTHAFALEEAEQALLTLGGEIDGEEAICVSLHPEL